MIDSLLHWSPLAISGVALGIWWALRRSKKLPTVRMVLAVIVGWGIVQLAGPEIMKGGSWIQSAVSAVLPGRWALLIPVLLVAFVFFAAVVVLTALHPREKPDHSAEWFAVFLAAGFLLIGGSI